MATTFNDRERATVLAALRAYRMRPIQPGTIRALASCHGTLQPLSDAEIDALCARMAGRAGTT